MTRRSLAPDGDAGEQDQSVESRWRRWVRWVLPPKPKKPLNPALLKHAAEEVKSTQSRVSDWVTRFAGSMAFVYLHVIWFACWIGLAVEAYPFALLTMIVSLEAIFLSTFVLISQNRSDAKRQVIADEEWTMVQDEQHQNSDLLSLSKHQAQQNSSILDLSNQILVLTKEVRGLADTAREDTRHRGQQLLDLSPRTSEPAQTYAQPRSGDSQNASPEVPGVDSHH